MRPGSECTTRGGAGSDAGATALKRYEVPVPPDARRERDWLEPDRPDRVCPPRPEALWLLPLRLCELRVPRLDVLPLCELRVPRLDVLALCALRVGRLRERDELPPPEAAATPSRAPRTAPRVAVTATSPAFIAPASAYTAPRLNSSRARGDTAAAVAAATTPASLSM